jgi:hypothetical protein
VFNAKGAINPSDKAAIAVLKEATLSRKFLPVVAQRTTLTYLTANTGQFILVD